MRPRLIKHTPGKHGAVTPITTGGWVAKLENPAIVRVYDHNLATLTEVPAPPGKGRTHLTADAHHIVVSNESGLTVTTHVGTTRWHRPEPGESCHLANGILWTHQPETGHILALDPATGRQIARHGLPDAGNGWFTEHPQGEWTALNIIVCPIDHLQAWLLRLDNARITAQRLPDAGLLAGFLPGDRYLSTGPDGFAVQRYDGSHQIRRDIDDLPGSTPDRRLSEVAVVAPDDHILIAVSNDEDWKNGVEEHLLLSPGLRYRTVIGYPRPRTHNSLRSAAGTGRWLTQDRSRGVLELWELDGPLDRDVLPGQLSLFPMAAPSGLTRLAGGRARAPAKRHDARQSLPGARRARRRRAPAPLLTNIARSVFCGLPVSLPIAAPPG